MIVLDVVDDQGQHAESKEACVQMSKRKLQNTHGFDWIGMDCGKQMEQPETMIL